MLRSTDPGGPPGDERLATLALACVPGIGPVAHRAFLSEHGSSAAALRTLPAERASPAWADARRHAEAARRAGARLLVAGDADYPESLRDLHDPPLVLWALGDPALAAGPAAARVDGGRARVAIVGTRRASAYGGRVAAELAAAFAAAGAVVVSGMAVGIDAAAHVAALDAGAPSIAVLGTGIDVAYPVRHRRLHRRLAEHGLVLSEFPPGAPGTAGAFPRRNRLIAALCPLTIVVEAGVRSGALITAGHALDVGRAVAAVPGRISDPEAAGANELLRDGAHVITSVADALALLDLGPPRAARPAPAPSLAQPVLDGDEQLVWDALATAAPDADALTTRVSLPACRCLSALGTLELAGHVECDAAGEIRRRE